MCIKTCLCKTNLTHKISFALIDVSTRRVLKKKPPENVPVVQQNSNGLLLVLHLQTFWLKGT